jgi:hypothetical protein
VTVDLALVTDVPQNGRGYSKEDRTGDIWDKSGIFVFFLGIIG